MDSNIKDIDSHAVFSKKLLTFIRPPESDAFRIYGPRGVRLLNRLCFGFQPYKGI